MSVYYENETRKGLVDTMTLLYHGTNGKWLDNIARCGLEPRGRVQSRNNWKHVAHQSNPNAVYLTDSYAPYFSFNAARGNTPLCAVIEIDSDELDEEALTFDEDCWEQLGRNRDGIPGTMSERTLYWRKRQNNYESKHMYTTKDGISEAWLVSLMALGTCSYLGTIPHTALRRAVMWPQQNNAWLSLVWDPSIVIVNQQFCGNRYRALTARLFGDNTLPELNEFDKCSVNSFNPDNIKGLQRFVMNDHKWIEEK